MRLWIFQLSFEQKRTLNLDKNTLNNSKIYSHFWSIFCNKYSLFLFRSLPFPIELSYIIIFIGLLTNFYLQFGIKINQLKRFLCFNILVYDLIQLSILLYLTGGIFNPFCFLLIIPAIVSSTFLSMGTTIILGFITSFFINNFILSFTSTR